MSNFGQAVLTIVGTVVGAYFGNPELGFVLGSLAGQLIFPTQLPGTSGPRLNDTRTTTATLGGPVQEVIGTDAVAGTVIWLAPLREVSTTESTGKGGPSQDNTTFTYFQSIAIGLCRGPIHGVRRIWENGALLYDARPQLDDEDDDTFTARQVSNYHYRAGFVLYVGTDVQLPDPTVELDQGIGETPAYRGLAYLVYVDRQLKNEQGLRHPNFKFEVIGIGDTLTDEIVEFAVGYYPPWPSQDPPIPAGRYDADSTYVQRYQEIVAYEAQTTGATNYQGYSIQFFPHGEYPLGNFQTNQQNSLVTTWEGLETVRLHFNRSQGQPLIDPDTGLEASDLCSVEEIAPGEYEYRHSVGDYIHMQYTPPSAPNVMFKAQSTLLSGPVEESPYDDVGTQCNNIAGKYLNWIGSTDRMIDFGRREWPLEPTTYPEFPWIIDETLGVGPQYRVLRRRDYPDALQCIGPTRPQGHADDTEAFWTDAYDQAVLRGELPDGLAYGVDYPELQSYAWKRSLPILTMEDAPIPLSDVVTYLCGRVDVPPEAIDVSDLEDVTILGYTVSRIMNVKDAIDPLRLVGFFDYVESGRILKFPTRGKAAVRTLTDDDLGAHEDGAEPGPAVTTKMIQDVELPRRVHFHYRSPARDYDPGEQPSPSRLTTDAIHEIDIECAVAITDEMAARAAEVNWADAWAGRWVHSTSLDRTQSDLEVADAVLLPVDGRLERVRIVSFSGAIIEQAAIEAVRDDDGTYVSVAIAAPPIRPPATIRTYSPTDLLFLDLPALRTADDDPGFYLAAGPRTTARWTGASLYRSTDGGVTFAPLLAVTSAATAGDVVAALGSGTLQPDFDEVGELLVELDRGSLESRTDADLLDDFANAAAVGIDGRFEVLQFGTATLIGPKLWRLTHLLRGRRGTEYLVGTGVSGDRFALLTPDGLVRLPLSLAQRGVELTYWAVTIGTDYASGIDYPFAGHAQALVPFSPVDVAGSVEDDDVLLTWQRRDRMGQELTNFVDPLSDVPLAFEVELLNPDDSPGSVRLLTSNVERVTYSAAQVEEDFGPTPYPITLEVTVYQISPQVGRGIAGRATLVLSNVHEEDVSGTTAITLNAGGTLIDANKLVGSTSIVLSTTGTMLRDANALVGSADVTLNAAGTLIDANALAGNADFNLSLGGTLIDANALAGITDLTLTLSGTLIDGSGLSGSTDLTFSVGGTLIDGNALSGNTTINLDASGTLDDANA